METFSGRVERREATRKADQTDGIRAVHLRQFGYPADVILV
jgi:hypothetical protein